MHVTLTTLVGRTWYFTHLVLHDMGARTDEARA